MNQRVFPLGTNTVLLALSKTEVQTLQYTVHRKWIFHTAVSLSLFGAAG